MTRDTVIQANARRTRRRVFVLTAVALLGAACKKEAPKAAIPEVLVTEAVQRDVPVYLELVGQTKGAQDVEIRARVEGFLDTVAFTEGTFVRKGDLLYEIDPKPLQATLANARANLVTAQARLQKTTNDVARLRPLAQEQAVSQQELDNAVSAQDAARAQVDAYKAAADNASIDLSYTRVLSPIDGLAGTTLVKPGNLVGRGESTLLTTVSQVDPILFRAGVSEAEYLRLARLRDERAASGIAPAAASAGFELILADGTVHPHAGRLDAIERAVDPTTGTLAIQVSFPNPERLVRPGQFGRIRFEADRLQGALRVPQRAVQELQNLHTLAVVGAGDKVEVRNVEVGPRVESLWVITRGLAPGEKVIVEGVQRARDGMVVKTKPVTPPAPGEGAAEPAAGAAGPR